MAFIAGNAVWDVMLLCVAVATAAGLFSARFANRVKNRTAGLVTGAVLTLLGAAMLILNFREQLSQISLFIDIPHCFGVTAAYMIPGVLVLLPIRFLTKPPSFIFSKLAAFTCVSLMILAGHGWQAAAWHP